MDTECPLCFKIFPRSLLEQHVNSCLDLQDRNTSNNVKLPTKHDKEETGDPKVHNTEASSRQKHDVFTSLGLKMDSFDPKKQKTDSKASNNTKGKPTLTSLLIAEKRMKGYGSGEKKIKIEEEHSNTSTKAGFNKRIIVDDDQEQRTKKAAFPQEIENKVPVEKTQSSNDGPKQSNALTKNQEFMRLKREAELPLAQRLRPKSLDEYYGQEKLVGENGILKNIIKSDQIPSFILWGVPGVGKTSLARIISQTSNCKFLEVSGAEGNAKQLREVFTMADNERRLTGRKTILFLDEIHRFNKAVQDLLLPVIEKGIVTVIGATTENPSFTLNNALLSRMHTFIMEPLLKEDIVKIINRGLLVVNKSRKLVFGLHLIALDKDAIDYIASLSAGDSRVALNILESINAYLSSVQYSRFSGYEEGEKAIQIPKTLGVIKVCLQNLKPLLETRNYQKMYDKQGESHYDTISAFHKSVRGSDADAAVFYLVKMLVGGEDPLFIARRMIVIASEDVGLRDSSCLPFAIATKEALEFVGMPEGEIILAHCATKLARAPKSTKSYRALRSAQSLFKENPDTTSIPIPLHLRNAPTKLMKEFGYGDNYKYNPSFTHGKVKQDYMPKELRNVKFMEETHLGTTNDPSVDSYDYEMLLQERNDYLNFKRKWREASKNSRKSLGSIERARQKPRKRATKVNIDTLNHDSNSNNLEANNTEKDLCQGNNELPRYSYDEFLSKEDQPEYFDGEEIDEYSDDPNCSHNFECSYDEFLNKEDQPDYFDGAQCDEDYPIFYDNEEQ